MKKKLTLISTVLIVVMLFSLTACGKSEPEVNPQQPATPGEPIMDLEGVEPESLVDPSLVNMGQAVEEERSGDAWYKDGIKGGDYICFEPADNSDMGYAYVKVEGGEKVETLLCTINAEQHVVDADAQDGDSSIDLVFVDSFKIYDYKTNTWYVRGDPQEISTIFAGISFVCQDDETNTLLLKADGTGTEVFQGQEDALTWVMKSATTVTYNDGSFDHELQIVLDETGSLVSLSEQNFRIFVPAEAK